MVVFAVGFLCFLLLPEALLGHHIRALGAPLTRVFLHRAQQAGNATATAHHWERIGGPWGCSSPPTIERPSCTPASLGSCSLGETGTRTEPRPLATNRFLECDPLAVEAGGRATCCPRRVSDANEYTLCNSVWIFLCSPFPGSHLGECSGILD